MPACNDKRDKVVCMLYLRIRGRKSPVQDKDERKAPKALTVVLLKWGYR